MGNQAKMENMGRIGGLRLLYDLASRVGLLSRTSGGGTTYAGARDLYAECGWPKTLSYADLQQRYDRQDVARRVVEAYPVAAWRKAPEIVDDDNPETQTPFEAAWVDMNRQLWVVSRLKTLDILSGIGEYGAMFIGFDDAATDKDQAADVMKGASPVFLRPYGQGDATIEQYETDPASERYGLPVMYKIPYRHGDGREGTIQVHWSRILHVVWGSLGDPVKGTPKMQPVYNRLQDLEKVVGGSSEMFWRGGFPGYNFALDASADLEDDTLTDMQEDIQKYIHGLQRYLTLQGVDVKAIDQQIADPGGQVKVLIGLISAATGIPQRLLLGAEQGELASSQDRINWGDKVDDYRENHVEPNILRPFISRMVDVGALPAPTGGGYEIRWPERESADESERAEIGKKRAEALATYMREGLEALMPFPEYAHAVLGIDKDEAMSWMEAAADSISQDVLDGADLEDEDAA